MNGIFHKPFTHAFLFLLKALEESKENMPCTYFSLMPGHALPSTPLTNTMQTQSGKWGSTPGSQALGLFQPRIYL